MTTSASKKTSIVKAIVLIALLTPTTFGAPQTAQSKGKKNVVVGVNNGEITMVNREIKVDPAVLKRLVAEALGEGLQQGDWKGVLFPGNEPTDLGSCKEQHTLKSTDTVVKMGTFTAICTSLPCAIVSVNGRIVLAAQQLGKSVSLMAEFRAEDGDMVAVLDGNKWRANDKESWYAQRPDEHSMQVMDHKNNEMLWVSLKNQHYLAIRGHFLDERGAIAAIVTDSDLQPKSGPLKGTMKLQDICMVQAGALPPGYVLEGGPTAILQVDTVSTDQ